MRPFKPCREFPGCPDVTGDQAVSHDWRRALTFALRRVAGQKCKHTVKFDGRHWIVEKEGGGL